MSSASSTGPATHLAPPSRPDLTHRNSILRTLQREIVIPDSRDELDRLVRDKVLALDPQATEPQIQSLIRALWMPAISKLMIPKGRV